MSSSIIIQGVNITTHYPEDLSVICGDVFDLFCSSSSTKDEVTVVIRTIDELRSNLTTGYTDNGKTPLTNKEIVNYIIHRKSAVMMVVNEIISESEGEPYEGDLIREILWNHSEFFFDEDEEEVHNFLEKAFPDEFLREHVLGVLSNQIDVQIVDVPYVVVTEHNGQSNTLKIIGDILNKYTTAEDQ
jgi:hypothetical protein